MSTVLADIQQAIEVQAQAVLAPLFGEQIAFPNVRYTPNGGRAYAKVDHLPAQTSPAGAGINALTLRPGLTQISIFQPEGEGTAGHVAAAQAITDGFPRGLSLSRNGTIVRILSVSPGPYLNEPGWAYQPISIRWQVHSVD